MIEKPRLSPSKTRITDGDHFILEEMVRRGLATTKSEANRMAIRMYGFYEGIRKVPASA